MAAEYFLYTTLYDNTLVDRSKTSFSPAPPYGEIYIDFLIPQTQPLYLYKESLGTIVLNDDATINAYLEGNAPPPQPNDPVFQENFTGFTATTNIELNNIDSKISYLSGQTDTKLSITDFNSYSGITYTDINSRVYRSGDTMTGTLNTTGNLLANGAVTGSSIHGSVLITTPILNASTSICAPQITGSTCITSPISCATTRMQAPVVCGGTCVCSPIVSAASCVCAPTICATTIMQSPAICGQTFVNSPIISGVTSYAGSCLCSLGTTWLNGATTAASTLNVSGITTLGNTLYLGSVSTGGTLSDYNIVWNPISNEVRAIPVSGGTANVYCYIDKRTQQDNTTNVDATYLTATWNLPSGYYEYEYGAIYGNDTSNRCAIICFLFDGVVVGSCNLMKTNDTNVRTSAYITQNNSLIGGNHTAAMVFRQCGGGTSSVYSGTIRIQKIGA